MEHWAAGPYRLCVDFGGQSVLSVVQAVGDLLIPVIGACVIARVAHRYPTSSRPRTGGAMGRVLGAKATKWCGAIGLVFGLAIFAVDTIWPVQRADHDCVGGLGLLSATGLLFTLTGAVLLGLAWAYIAQANWILLATIVTLDAWIVWGMVMMHATNAPNAPAALMLLAFFMHGVCMCLTTVWTFRTRDASTMGQIRAGEPGRSIGAVWIFLAAYIVVGFFYDEQGLFSSSASGAVVSALTVSALAVTMGGGYTRYREVMRTEGLDVSDAEQARAQV